LKYRKYYNEQTGNIDSVATEEQSNVLYEPGISSRPTTRESMIRPRDSLAISEVLHLSKRPSSSVRVLAGTPAFQAADDTSIYSRTFDGDKSFDAFDPSHGRPTTPTYQGGNDSNTQPRKTGERSRSSQISVSEEFGHPLERTRVLNRSDSGIDTSDDKDETVKAIPSPLAMILGCNGSTSKGTLSRTAFLNLSMDGNQVDVEEKATEVKETRESNLAGNTSYKNKERYPGFTSGT
jgi:hypothetical protein